MRIKKHTGSEKIRSGKVLLACGVFSGLTPLPAYSGEQANRLEEVTVTARKRAESLQTVPVSVSALSGEAIARTFADSLKDLEGMAPNVVIDTFNAFPNSASISIRGIGHTEIEKSFDPVIGVMVDGVFLGSNAQAMIDNFDLERVEILRGPQGTLFGKNTIGGTINVTRTKPDYELRGKASLGHSSFDKNDVQLAVNVPSLVGMPAT